MVLKKLLFVSGMCLNLLTIVCKLFGGSFLEGIRAKYPG